MRGERDHGLPVGLNAQQLAGVGVQQGRGAADEHLPQRAGVGGRSDLLGELGQAGERVDPAALAIVELGVLDRA